MKIRRLTPELYPKADGLLMTSFPASTAEARLVEQLHQNSKVTYEWVGIQANKVIAYIGFTNAYNGNEVCGLHLAPLVVKREYRGRGIARELINFAKRQAIIKERVLYVLGEPRFFKKFGFMPCAQPVCPFDTDNKNFLSFRNPMNESFTVGYEPEFKALQ